MGSEGMRLFTGQDYASWSEDFDFYLKSKNLDGARQENSEQCLGMFIHFGGIKIKEVYKLYKDHDKTVWTHTSYQHAREMVDLRLLIRKNQTYETFLFRNVKQRGGESFNDFVHRIEVAVTGCGFGALDRDRHVRDQIVFGTTDVGLREKAISENLSLTKIWERGNAIECSSRFSAAIQVKEEPGPFQANAVTRRDMGGQQAYGATKDRYCYNCGESPWPHSFEKGCPAKDQRCGVCGRFGHIEKFCRDNPKGQNYRGRSVPGGRGRGENRSRDGVNAVSWREGENNESEHVSVQSLRGMVEEDLYVFSAREGGSIEGKLSILVDNRVKVYFLPDTGASVNIIDKSTYDVLCQAGRYPLFSTKSRIYAYGSDQPLKLRGYFNVQGCFNGRQAVLLIFVLDANNCGNLLSKSSCAALGVVEVCGESVSVNNISGGSNNPLSGGYNHVTSGMGEDVSGVINSISGSGTNISGVSDCSGPIPSNISELLEQFPEGIGCVKGVELKLNIDKAVTPVVQAARRIPISMKGVVEEKIRDLERDDIIERADGPTSWLSPVHVVKQSSGVRMVIDMSLANAAIKRTRRTLPTPEEIFCELDGAMYFSKVDMNSAYHQILLHPDSRYITTFATHTGTYRCKRLFFGVGPAAEEFNDILSGKLAGLKGVKNAADDILVFGKTREDHDKNLYELLLRLLEAGITINKKKCVFGAKEVSFFGQWVSGKGIRPMIKDNLRYIQRPNNKSEVRSYMGLVTFIGKFIPDFSTVVAPISALMGKNADYVWGPLQEEAFQAILTEIKSPRILRHFDPKKETDVIVDASPVGLSAILSQEDRPVLCVSRKLSKVETRYSQTEREALAVVWACERLHYYLYGIKFTVLSDHKPLEVLYSPRGKSAARILRWYIRLLPYRFVVRYRRGKDNPADYFSRKPVSECSGEEETLAHEAEYFVNSLITSAIPHCLTLQEITVESVKDKLLQRLVQCMEVNDWVGTGELARYRAVRDELMYKNGIVMRGERIVLPQALRDRAVRLAHATHMGLTKTKQYLRAKLWWPGLDADVEGLIKGCGVCQAVNPDGAERLEPLGAAPFPDRPFSKVHIDLFGPLHTGETILGIVDEFSKWPELYVLEDSTKTEEVIAALDNLFSRFGSADTVVSDNGPQFISWEFKNYIESKGIRHHLVTPYHPQANSTVERFFRNLKKFVKVCNLEKKCLKEELDHFLRLFRNTPSRATGRTPASLVLSYEPRVDFPRVNANNDTFQEVKKYNAQYKEKMKEYADKTNNFRFSQLKEGDKVLIKNITSLRKHDPVFHVKPFTITHLQGNQVHVRADDGQTFVRPLSYVKKFVQTVKKPCPKIDLAGFRQNVFK